MEKIFVNGTKELDAVLKVRRNQTRETERGELLRYFTDAINKTRDGKRFKKFSIAAIAVKLSHLKQLSDLYYMKSIMEDIDRRNGPDAASKWFWWSLKRPNDL